MVQKSTVRAVFSGILALALLLLLVPTVLAVQTPMGGNITVLRNETAPEDAASAHPAFAGNVSEILLSGYSSTQSWQGYFGNVSGTIMLADANDNVMYNWSLASPQGEVYASVNDTIYWLNIQCFNYTATGEYDSSSETAGATNLKGMNLSQLEAAYGVAWDDVDGVSETFAFSGAASHDLFYTASNEFSSSECVSTRVYSDAGTGEITKFEEVLLYEPVSSSVVFTAILEEDVLGFDGSAHDFEMLVLENGHGTDVSTTDYYFFVELQ